MSVDIDYLKQRGISSSHYKKIFDRDISEYTSQQQRLVRLISSRNRAGYEQCLREHRPYAAVDMAYEVPFSQTTPTLVQHIMSKNVSMADTVELLKTWGLSKESLFMEVPSPNKPGETVLIPNPPVLFQIYIPIVKAYVTAIEAQLFNPRNDSPLFPYRPLKGTPRNQVLCEIVTDVVDTMSTWFGKASVLEQAIKQMLKYGQVVAFPQEEWYREEHVRTNDGIPETYIVKEGLRHMMPHPTRSFIDPEYPATSINTDTGVSYGAHWHVLTYGDVLDNEDYWNRTKIFGGINWMQHPLAGHYFDEVFPCGLKFLPTIGATPATREDKTGYYTTDHRDKAIFVTQHFMKLIPDKWGLVDLSVPGHGYKYPVWHRFTIAGDDTVVYAEPCAYNPMWFMGYDYDFQASRSPSFALELIPWQDHLGNILSQMLLTMKQNLLNVIFYNESGVDKADIDRMSNLGEAKYRGLQFIGYDPLKMMASRVDMDKVFTQVNFQKIPIAEMLQAIGTVLNIMERVLGISAQVVGAAASHQQSKAEVLQTGASSTNRIEKIGSSVDSGVDAWMRQEYTAYQAYGDPTYIAEISTNIENLDTHISSLGLEVKGRTRESVVVSGNKRNLRLEGFASVNKGPRTSKDKETSQALWQTITTLSSNPVFIERVGVDNVIQIIELAAQLAGAPRDFELKIPANLNGGGGVTAQVMEAIKAAQQATLQAVAEKVGKPAAEHSAQMEQRVALMEQVVEKLKGIFQIAQQLTEKRNLAAQEAAAEQQIRQAEFQAEESRKQEEFNREQARKDAETQAKIQTEREAANAKLQIDVKTAGVNLALKEKESAAKIEASKKTTQKSP